MKNVNLNFGGFIGAIAGAGVGALIIYLMGNLDAPAPKLFVYCIIGGALAGNILWWRISSTLRSRADKWKRGFPEKFEI